MPRGQKENGPSKKDLQMKVFFFAEPARNDV
jgi:hypothetical protein